MTAGGHVSPTKGGAQAPSTRADHLRGTAVVGGAQGLHLRPSSEIARVVSESGLDARFNIGGREANAASVLELAMLAAQQGTEIEVTVSAAGGTGGDGAEALLARLLDLVRTAGA